MELPENSLDSCIDLQFRKDDKKTEKEFSLGLVN